MGASHSKTANGKRSPSQEKHTSADSTTPLARNASQMNLDRSPTVEKHTSVGGTTLGRSSRANTLSTTGVRYSTADDITITPATPRSVRIDDFEGHGDVSRPPLASRPRHLSELIDPANMPIDSHVRSPSGHMLAPEQFLVHPDRPRSIRERQEEIREKVRAASRLGVDVDGMDETPAQSPKKARGGWSCFCC